MTTAADFNDGALADFKVGPYPADFNVGEPADFKVGPAAEPKVGPEAEPKVGPDPERFLVASLVIASVVSGTTSVADAAAIRAKKREIESFIVEL